MADYGGDISYAIKVDSRTIVTARNRFLALEKTALSTINNINTQAQVFATTMQSASASINTVTRALNVSGKQQAAITTQTQQLTQATNQQAVATRKVAGAAMEGGRGFMEFAKGVVVGMVTYRAFMLVINGVTTAIKTLFTAAIDFEYQFANIRKVFQTTEPVLKKLEHGFRNLAKEVPRSIEEILTVGRAAGQLGIQTGNVVEFTRNMIALAETSADLSVDEAAMSLARFANITQQNQANFDKLAATVSVLGDNAATTEGQIVKMGLRIAAAGQQVGLTQPEILTLATVLQSVGVRAEMGGTAISRLLLEISRDVETAGGKLKVFAKVAGMSVEAFTELYKTDPMQGLTSLISGLREIELAGGNVAQTLRDLGMVNIRTVMTVLGLKEGFELLGPTLERANIAHQEGNYHLIQAQKRYDTLHGRLQILKNVVMDLAISFGTQLLPGLKSVTEKNIDLAKSMEIAEGAARRLMLTLTAIGLAFAAGPIMRGFGVLTTAIRFFAIHWATLTAKGGVAFFTKLASSAAVAGTALKGAWIALAPFVKFVAIAAASYAVVKFFDGVFSAANKLRDEVKNLNADIEKMSGTLKKLDTFSFPSFEDWFQQEYSGEIPIVKTLSTLTGRVISFRRTMEDLRLEYKRAMEATYDLALASAEADRCFVGLNATLHQLRELTKDLFDDEVLDRFMRIIAPAEALREEYEEMMRVAKASANIPGLDLPLIVQREYMDSLREALEKQKELIGLSSDEQQLLTVLTKVSSQYGKLADVRAKLLEEGFWEKWNKEAKIHEDYAEAIKSIYEDIEAAIKAADPTPKFVETLGSVQAISEQMKALDVFRNMKPDGGWVLLAKNLSNLDLQIFPLYAKELQQMEKEIDKTIGKSVDRIFTQMSRSMADNLVTWQSWGQSLVNIIQDIGSAMLASMLRGFFNPLVEKFTDIGIALSGGMLGGLFGGSTGAVGAQAQGGAVGSANGNAFRNGQVVPFANGGVIKSPIAFPLGIAGENNKPEAIMPLANVSGGLGVRAIPSNVNISITTPPNTRASVSETDSGNGDREISILISEIVAGEMQRYGSPVHKGLRNRTNTIRR